MASKFSTNIETMYTKDFVKESLVVTGSVISGTYPSHESTLSNIKNDTLGYYQTVYDYPHLSQSANPLFDVTWGWRSGGVLGDKGRWGTLTNPDPVSGTTTDVLAKNNIYNQMAALILGYDQTGSVRVFDLSGSFDTIQDESVMNSPVFINFSRLVMKDELKAGTFELKIDPGVYVSASMTWATKLVITDDGDDLENGLKILRSRLDGTGNPMNVGILDRYRGIAVIQLSGSSISSAGISDTSVGYFVSASDSTDPGERSWNFEHSIYSGTISELSDGLRHRIQSVSVQNATQLNQTTYYVRAGASDFNYSANPSYINANSRIRVLLDSDGNIIDKKAYAYVTGIGLYSADGELLAVAKISKPVKKDSSSPLTIGVKLTY